MGILTKKEFKIVLTFFIIYLCFAQFQNWNDNSKFNLTRAIVDEHRFEIDSYINNTGDRAYYDGHYYSDKAPGASFLTVPIYAVFKLFFGMPNTDFKLHLLEFMIIALTSAFFSALLVILMYKISRFFVKKETYRMLITIIFGLGTGIFVYSTIYYQYGISIFFAFLCFYLIFKMKQGKKGNYYFVAGLFGGVAFITDYLVIIIILCCLSMLIFNKKWKKIFSFLAGFSILVLVLLIYNHSIFNNPFDLSYIYLDEDLKNNEINKYGENLVELWEQNNMALDYINFGEFFKPNEFVCVYALTYIYSPEEQEVQIRTGSDDRLKVWLNDHQIIENKNARKAIMNQDISGGVLKEGWNKILIKVCNNKNTLKLFFIVTGKKGESAKDLKYSCFFNNKDILTLNSDKKCKYLIIGPFDNSPLNKKSMMWEFFLETSGFEKKYPPEYEIIINKSYIGKENTITWQVLSETQDKKIKFNFLTKGIFTSIKRIPKNLGYVFNISIRLLFYPYRGLFFYNPILILSLIGLFFMFKNYKLETILIIISFILLLLMSSVQWMWWQGSSFGPRLLMLIIPFFMLPLMFCIKKINKNILLFFMILCIFINLLGMQEFEQSINEGGNSFEEITQRTMEKHKENFYSMKPLGNPLFTYYMPLFFRYGPRSILIEQILGFRLPPFLNVFVLMIIVLFIWRKKLIRKIKKDFNEGVRQVKPKVY